MTLAPFTLSDDQRAILALWFELNASLSSYHKLIHSYGSAQLALQAGVESWRQLGMHHTHLARHEQPEQTRASIDKIQQALIDNKYSLLFTEQPNFPTQLLEI